MWHTVCDSFLIDLPFAASLSLTPQARAASGIRRREITMVLPASVPNEDDHQSFKRVKDTLDIDDGYAKLS